MRLRNVKNAREIVDNSPFVVHEPKEFKGKYNEVFGNNNPIELEIGMGKGNFIIDKAMKNPDINFIGVERYESVLCRALEKLEDKQLPNVKIICIDAIELDEVFDKEISTIYLNFSDPWPKKRHAKRRLTSHVFLPVYDLIFKDEKVIVQKTDNVGLFESSIVSLSTYGYTLEDISLDLASTGMENSLTEYEAKFMSQGIKINYLKARKK
ncbi:MAG: tRNA (guanosine(46)-N7)-methyltransferase TrmB [Bacilli bacterium]|nr:tRNA (guanosine(46)-N7)-methyltransferase TrmB [Bacillota bacterium]MBR6820873.1 tRNA (guanosine(46)-N7)-methyltransferase TrmB [Bacilli bacterium]